MKNNRIRLFCAFLFIANILIAQQQFSPQKLSQAAIDLTKKK